MIDHQTSIDFSYNKTYFNLSNGSSHSGVHGHLVNNNQTGATNIKNNLGNNLTDVEHLKQNPNYINNQLKKPVITNKTEVTKQNPIKSSPQSAVGQQTSMKRSNEETNNGASTMAPNNKIPKYVIDQKSAS